MKPIIPLIRKDAFDDPAWVFELKDDGFRGLADTLNRRIVSRNRNRLKRFEGLLESLPEMARSSPWMKLVGQSLMISCSAGVPRPTSRSMF
jgi:hypothetical protein